MGWYREGGETHRQWQQGHFGDSAGNTVDDEQQEDERQTTEPTAVVKPPLTVTDPHPGQSATSEFEEPVMEKIEPVTHCGCRIQIAYERCHRQADDGQRDGLVEIEAASAGQAFHQHDDWWQ